MLDPEITDAFFTDLAYVNIPGELYRRHMFTAVVITVLYQFVA